MFQFPVAKGEKVWSLQEDVFSCSSVEECVSKSSEIQESTNIRGYYDDLISKDSLYLPSRLSFENTECLQA